MKTSKENKATGAWKILLTAALMLQATSTAQANDYRTVESCALESSPGSCWPAQIIYYAGDHTFCSTGGLPYWVGFYSGPSKGGCYEILSVACNCKDQFDCIVLQPPIPPDVGANVEAGDIFSVWDYYPSCYESLPSSIFLDVGNDTDYEWYAPRCFRGPETVDVTESLNNYVRGGCWCTGCVYDSDSRNCTVPVVFKSDYPGWFTIDNVKLTFTKLNTLGEVTYGTPFRNSEGGCWMIQYKKDPETYTPILPVPADYHGGVCDMPDYVYKEKSGPITTDDAVDDAVYRLLNGTLDTNGDGIMDLEYKRDKMEFQTEGKIGVQTLWGPIQMRLVVWS
ncbi:MAG: hypothetical protein V1744_01965 [Candidatus Altiarchaeota archaeon]